MPFCRLSDYPNIQGRTSGGLPLTQSYRCRIMSAVEVGSAKSKAFLQEDETNRGKEKSFLLFQIVYLHLAGTNRPYGFFERSFSR